MDSESSPVFGLLQHVCCKIWTLLLVQLTFYFKTNIHPPSIQLGCRLLCVLNRWLPISVYLLQVWVLCWSLSFNSLGHFSACSFYNSSVFYIYNKKLLTLDLVSSLRYFSTMAGWRQECFEIQKFPMYWVPKEHCKIDKKKKR